MDQFTQILHTHSHRLTAQPGRMRVVQSRLLTPPNLQCCHSSHPISLNPPFLVLLPPKQYPSLKNQTFPPIPHKPTSSFPFGSLIRASMASSTTPSTATETETKPFSVLFVCLGNICRSPAAEGVFRDLVKKRGFDSKFNIDSAGTIDYHEVGTLSFNYAPLFVWLLKKQGNIGVVIVLTKFVFFNCCKREMKLTQEWGRPLKGVGLRLHLYQGQSGCRIFGILILFLQWTGKTEVGIW